MKGKILLVVGLGVGYVLGSRAGRERYDQIVAKANQFWNDPRVKTQVNNAQEFVKDKAPDVADFISKNVRKPAGSTVAKKPAARKSPTSRSTKPAS
ncbi:MAG TPA: YtxH domain-containing protein [Galbitalea sp.]|jgi:hypothetical protein